MDFDILIKAIIFLVICPAFVIWGIIFLGNRRKKHKNAGDNNTKVLSHKKVLTGKQIVSITIIALFVVSIFYLIISYQNEPHNSQDLIYTSESSTALTTSNEITIIEKEDIIDHSLVVEYDDLQEFYVNFPADVSYMEAKDYIENFGLPYSEVKYNGSRAFQISTASEGTRQKYNKSGLPYIMVHYEYPKNENSSADILEKYFFTSVDYYPKGRFSFHYTKKGLEVKGRITELGDDINQELSREDQIIFYYQYKDSNKSFK